MLAPERYFGVLILKSMNVAFFRKMVPTGGIKDYVLSSKFGSP